MYKNYLNNENIDIIIYIFLSSTTVSNFSGEVESKKILRGHNLMISGSDITRPVQIHQFLRWGDLVSH